MARHRAGDLWGSALDAGQAKREPDLPPLEIAAGGPLAICDDVEHLRDQARPHAGPLLRGHGRPRAELLQRRAEGLRVAAYRDSGVTILNVQPSGPNGLADVETVAGWLS